MQIEGIKRKKTTAKEDALPPRITKMLVTCLTSGSKVDCMKTVRGR